jgi:predicted negative regulator of RcsB-dependent stress response
MKYYYSFILSLALLLLSLRASLVATLSLLPLTLYFGWRIYRQIQKSRHNTASTASTALTAPTNSIERNLSIALYIIAFCLTLFRSYTTLVYAGGLTP